MVTDDKGGEVMHKDSEKMTKGENLTQGERYDKGKGSIKILSAHKQGEQAHELVWCI